MTTPEHRPPPHDASPEAPDAHESLKPIPSPLEPSRRDSVAGRPKLLEAIVERDRGGNAVVRVSIERGGTERRSEREAIGEEAVVLRSVAEATLDALTGLSAGEPAFALVGVKRLLAFDSAVILACVRTTEGPPHKLIGCVPIHEGPVMAVARAVLHATNRIVENIPDVADTPDAEAGSRPTTNPGAEPLA